MDIHNQISIDRNEVIRSFRNLQKFRNYSSGIQDSTLTLDQEIMLRGVIGNQFCDNVCTQILSEHTDRLELKRVTCQDDTVQKWIDTFWQKNKIDDLSQRVHRNTIRDGNFCLQVEYDFNKNCIRINREKWWDGGTGVFIGYDVYGNILYAVKQWRTPDGIRRTIYYEGIVERYISSGGNSWFPFLLPSDIAINKLSGVNPGTQLNSEPIPLPYVDEDGNPLHIPFIHFSNPSDDYENYGSSILDGGMIGLQDQINDLQYDISAAARMGAYQSKWGKGYPLQKIKGVSVKPKTGPGTFYHSENADAEWGVLPAGDLSQLLSVHTAKVETACRMTSTPSNVITGNWPSGEAVYKIEQPIRGKTKARQKRFSPSWVETIHRCMELANLYDGESLNEDDLLTAVFTDAGDRDPLAVEMANLSFWQGAAAAVAAGLPIETYLRVAGWGEKEMKGLSTDIAASISARQSDLGTNPPKTTTSSQRAGGSTPGAPATAIKPTAATIQTARKQR